MRSRFGPILVLAILLVLAGCLASPSGSQSVGTTVRIVSPQTHVFDHPPRRQPAITGGIHFPSIGSRTQLYYATLVTSTTGARRFNYSILDTGARQFINQTDLSRTVLVVFQRYPASSRPDDQVRSVRRTGDRLQVSVARNGTIRTDDITVETVLVRVPIDDGKPPTRVTVTTASGVPVTSGNGVVTRTRPSTATPAKVRLPYAAVISSANVAPPRGLRIENHGAHTNGYHVTVTVTETPACRAETPPCMRPDRIVTILDRQGKLRPGASVTTPELVAKRVTYRLRVDAMHPTENGGRRTVTRAVDWRVGASDRPANRGNVTIVLTDSGLTVQFDGRAG